ncbi:membrane protein [Hymenobacter qilianensis]|uniref:Membrane protein n=2 Tax=Hymenobacter qilianensis TaxID=1385715 RepID=A0ACB5PXJ2_9BACT|nr:CPCC family cysteine-rich protein [Hymenobacter qilianensis]QNP54527.1 hydrolase [Hymenobacter qilianensis]GGF81733.1 membrane protein [Hymenobacter qilianensis]
MNNQSNKFGYYQCPCCAYYTFQEPATGHYDICPVCYWEDDPIQHADPAYEGGANQVSLNQARINYRDLGVTEPPFKRYVRPPKQEELPDER